jgi:RNA polymerase primary sigma factor
MKNPGPTSIDWIMQHSHRYPLLTPEEEIKLGRQVQAWLPLREKEQLTKEEERISRAGKRAYDRFFLSNIRLVVQLSGKYTRVAGFLTHEDLVQEGMLGLERAIVKFDSSRGYKFSTYAYNWIRQSIFRAISNKARAIRLPCSAFLTMNHARHYMEQVRKETGKLPSMEETAKEIGVNLPTLKAYFSHDGATISLDSGVKASGDSGTTYIEMLADPESMDDPLDKISEDHDVILAMLNQLDPLDQEIMKRRYFSNTEAESSYVQISKELGISRQACNSRHGRCLNRLRYKLGRARKASLNSIQTTR